jgi:DNA-binding NarL/FixJ family response regulator
MTAYRILVADDHEVVRHGIRALLAAQPNWEICAEAGDGCDAVRMALAERPDLAVLDLGMPNLNGLEATRQIVAGSPTTKVLILSLYESEQMIRELLEAGARGYLLKSDASLSLVKAAESLRNGRVFLTPRFQHMLQDGFGGRAQGRVAMVSLTAREREIVQLLGEGKSTKEVAGALNIAVKTAETHRANIMHKLDLHSISDLVMYAVRNRMVPIAPDAVKSPLDTPSSGNPG